MLKARQIVFGLFLFALFCNGEWIFIKFVKEEFYDEVDASKKTYCGKLFSKLSSIETHKHSSTNEFIFVVDFEEKGRRDFEVSASTYVTYNEGDRVCFTLKIDESRNVTFGEIFNFINAVASFIVTFILCVMLIVATCRWFVYGTFDLGEE